MATDVPFIPRELGKMLATLRAVIDTEPEVIATATQEWRVTVRNDRVVMTLDYLNAGRGAMRWKRSTLTVDGEPRPLAANLDDFARIFRNPDGVPGGSWPAVQPDEPLPPCDPNELPVVAKATYDGLAEALAGTPLAAAAITVGFRHRLWVIDLDTPRVHLRFQWRPARRGRGVEQGPMRLHVDGRDASAEVGKDLAKAMQVVAAATAGQSATPATIGAPAKGEGFGSVGVRRASVIRN